MENFSYEKNGRRFVIKGDTRCAPKGSLGKFGIGLNFDWDLKMWWTGKEDLAREAVDLLHKTSEEKSKAMASSVTFTKLPDDTWGVRVPLALGASAGREVSVQKSSGETKTETLGEEISRDSDFVFFRTIRKQRKQRTARSYRNAEYCYHMCPVGNFKCCPANGPCHDCL